MTLMNALLALTLLALTVSVASEDAGVAPDRAAVMGRVRQLIADQDVYAAIEHVQSLGAPPVVMKAYGELVMDLYWKVKDVPAVVVIGRAGILYALTKAGELEARSPEQAAPWFGKAKMIAYNVGSFTWPGWAEKGVKIAPSEMRAGRQAGALNLRLAVKLGRPAEKLSAARWLVGAHDLAAGRYEAAVRSFTIAGKLSREAGDRESEQMNAGYVGIGLILAGAEPNGRRTLDAAIKDLLAIGTDDAKSYAQQLPTALKALKDGKKRGK